MKNDAMKRTAGRPRSQIDHNLKGKRTVEIITEETGESPKQVQRYITLTNLIPELLQQLQKKWMCSFGNCKMGSGKLKLFGLKNRDSKVRLMKIIEVKENKKQYLDLLLLADKQEDIEGIFVSDEMQSCGIGKLLLDYIKDKKVSLRLNVYQKNARAISFY